MTPDEILARTQWDTFWVPDDVTVVARDELRFLASPRDIAGLNQVMHLSAPTARLPALVDEVVAAHDGRTSRMNVGPLFAGPALAPVLRAAGYAALHHHHGYVVAPADVAGGDPAGITVRPVASRDDLRGWNRAVTTAFGQPDDDRDDDLDAFLAQCTGPGARVHRVVAWDDATGEPLAGAGITAFDDLGFGFLWAGGTVPSGRGRGAYRAVLAARAAWAERRGLSLIGLYAREGTSGPIVDRLGFQQLLPMVIWQRG